MDVLSSSPAIKPPYSGLTLVELLVALTLSAILLGLAAPGFGDLIQRHQGEVIREQLAQAIELARVNAIRSASLVTLCRSDDGLGCGGNWADGVLVFVDEDNDREVDSGKQALRYFDFEADQGRLYWRSFGNRQYLQMTPLGFTKNQNGTFTFCPDSGDLSLAWMLILNRPGRARIAVDSDGDGLVEDSRGRPARC